MSRVWLREKGALLLQQETERGFAGDPCGLLKTQTGEWADAATDFEQQNAHSWLLQLAPNYFRYQFIRRAEIEAQDARVPGTYPGRPGVTPYAAVSAVGFNRNRTKAIVAVHLRLEGWLSILELKDGKWHAVGESCKWNA